MISLAGRRLRFQMLNFKDNEPCALVSDIQHYTIHDGPGIRTAVFFTGCTMRCVWCSNPETIEPRQRLGVYPAKCLSRQKCGLCVEACPLGGAPIGFDENGSMDSLRMAEGCEQCLKCADTCPPRAIKLWGGKMTLPELMAAIEGDRDFYKRSGGGVTLTGGEALLQWEFAGMLLKACKAASINTCVETALHCPAEHMEAVYQHTDIVIADIKHMDSESHRRFTGVGNERILGNIKRTVELGMPLVIRTPVVPGYNGDEENIRETARFIKDELGGKIVAYQLLPYRALGTEKYASLMLPYPMDGYSPPERDERDRILAHLADMAAREYGIPARVGADDRLFI